MPDFKEILDELKKKSSELIKLTVSNYKDEAIEDAQAFYEDSKVKLEKWTLLLANGDIDTEDFESLVAGQTTLLKMTALKQTALAKIRIDQFKNALLALTVDTIFNKVLP